MKDTIKVKVLIGVDDVGNYAACGISDVEEPSFELLQDWSLDEHLAGRFVHLVRVDVIVRRPDERISERLTINAEDEPVKFRDQR